MQRKNIHWILVLLIGMLATSCTPIYNLANSGIDPIVFTKPAYRGISTVNDFIGGKFTHSGDSAYQSNETNYFGQVYWFRTHTNEYNSSSFGAFAYCGNYVVKEVEVYNGKKNYYGGGISGDLYLNIPVDIIDVRIIGVKGTLYYENGDYRKFKILVKENYLANTTTDVLGYNVSFSSGVDVKLNKTSSIGLYGSGGISAEAISGNRFFTSSGILNYQTNRFTFFLQSTNTFLQSFSPRFGFSDEYSIGFNFRL